MSQPVAENRPMVEIEFPSGAGEDIPQLAGEKAEELFRTGQMLCAPAVLHVINQAFGGDLTPDQCCRITSGLAVGQGGAGCTCGALSGGNVAMGLMLGGNHCGSSTAQKVARKLHDGFKLMHGSTCCRVLSRKVKHDADLHMAQCARFTGNAAKLAAELILEVKPELAQKADRQSLGKRRGTLTRGLRRLLRVVS